MERLNPAKSSGISRPTLRKWGLLFLVAGVIGRGLIQGHILGIGGASTQQMLEVMERSPNAMTYATVAIVCQILETCAAPIFALLLVDGFQHTSDAKRYLLRVLGLALVTEIPYNLAMTGRLFAMSSRNPVFAMALGLILLCVYRHYSEKSMKNLLIKAAVTLAGFLWVKMLAIEFGMCLLLIICVLWGFRRNTLYRNFVGASVSIACSLINPFFLASPMGFLPIHMYNGETWQEDTRVTYLFYPAVLLAATLAGWFLF